MNKENFGLGFIIGVGVGALVGAAIGLLTAPKSGVETREDLAEYYGVAKDKATAYAAVAQEKGEIAVEKGKEYLALAQEKGAEVIAKGKEAIEQFKAKKCGCEAEETEEEFTVVEEG